jgi:hypothetical protein
MGWDQKLAWIIALYKYLCMKKYKISLLGRDFFIHKMHYIRSKVKKAEFVVTDLF